MATPTFRLLVWVKLTINGELRSCAFLPSPVIVINLLRNEPTSHSLQSSITQTITLDSGPGSATGLVRARVHLCVSRVRVLVWLDNSGHARLSYCKQLLAHIVRTSARGGLLSIRSVVSVLVTTHDTECCKNGWTNRHAVWGAGLRGPKVQIPHGRGTYDGNMCQTMVWRSLSRWLLSK